jgi:hypothetical protein
MVCDSEAILEETLMAIDESKLHMRRIGDRAVVAPAYQLEPIREALQERGTYPKVTGEIVPPDVLEETDEDEEEAEGEEEETDEEQESSEDEESA